MINIQPQLSEKKNVFPIQSHYKISRIAPYQGNSFGFSTGQTQMNFELPESVMNLSKTILEFNVNIVSGGAGIITEIPSDFCSFIQTVQLRSSNGQMLININDIDRYTKASWPYMIDSDENSSGTGYMCPSRRTGRGTDASIANDSYVDVNNLFTLVAFTPADSISSYQNYASSVSATVYNKTFTIPLRNLIPDSIFSLDKDIYVKPMNLQIIFRSSNLFGFYTNTAGGALSNFDVSSVAPTNQISSIQMLLYQQANQEAQMLVKSSYQKFVMPYIFSMSNNFTSAGTQTTNFKIISPSQTGGNSLLKTYYLITIPDGTVGVSTICNSSNYSAPAAPALQDPLSNPKLWSQFQNFLSGDQLLNFTTFQDAASHAINVSEHSFNGSVDYLKNSSVLTSFSPMKLGRSYDGETLEGIVLNNSNSVNISTNIQSAPAAVGAVSVSYLHHMFAVILCNCSIMGGEFKYE